MLLSPVFYKGEFLMSKKDTETVEVNPLCGNCQHYKPHKKTLKSPLVFGNWVGNGRCKIGRRLNPPDYVTVEGGCCEHWEAA